MHWQYSPYALLSLAVAAASAALALYTWHRRDTPGAGALALLMLAVAWWASAYSLELSGADLETKVFWAQAKYPGIVVVPTAWLVFALRYAAGPEGRLGHQSLALLAVEPLATLMLVFTNEEHHLVWTTRLDASGPYPVLDLGFGAWFWVNAAYSYLLLLVGAAALVRRFVPSLRLYRRQAWALLLGLSLPWMVNALYILGLSPVSHLDPTPFAFALTGAALLWGSSRSRLLDVVPAARDATIEGMRDGVIVIDAQNRVVDLNPAALRVLGLPVSKVVGQSATEVLPDLTPLVERSGDRKEAREEVKLGGGAAERRDYELRISALGNGGERRGGQLVLMRDVTERKRAEEALRKSQANLAEAQRIARLGSWEYAVDEDEAQWSDELYRIFGHNPRRFVPTYRTFVESIHPDDREVLLRQVHKALYEGEHYGHSAEFRLVRSDGEVRVAHVRYEVVREDEGGRPVKMLGTVQDVTERKALEDRLEHQAFHDHLTGLPNRALFMDRLAHALRHVKRREEKVAVLFMDLDNFKYVNDSLGHEIGDKLLVAVAMRLRSSLRPGDTAARLGGDEFCILLEGLEDRGEVVRVAEHIQQGLEVPFTLNGYELYSTASIGIILSGPLEEDLPGELLRRADLAMYAAKTSGKAQHAVFEERMNVGALERLKLENDLRRGLERGELRLLYQPKVLVESGGIAGFEALLRWEHPERGLVSPSEFVPLAEETGLIIPMGRWVLKEACNKVKEWQRLYSPEPSLLVSVNLSARQFGHPRLVEEIESTLQESGLEPGMLNLEITESIAMESAGFIVSKLERLRSLGIKLVVDDFGTGYSSLTYLKHLPVDYLKIDRSFVSGLSENPKDETIVSGIIALAQGLGLGIVAEGVETPAQLERLKEMGCELVQGYCLWEPLTEQEAAALLWSPLSSGGPCS